MHRIVEVESKADRRRFVRLARALYPADSPWVRPLDSTVLDYLDRGRNPFYRDGRGRAFLVERDGRAVGRILAHVWDRHGRVHGEKAGYFGFFECEDDAKTAGILLDSAAEFARGCGATTLRGPFQMTAAQEMGIVVRGFDRARPRTWCSPRSITRASWRAPDSADV